MASEVGGRLLALLGELQATTGWQIAVTHDLGKSKWTLAGSKWSLAGSTWKATVIVAPRWLGLEFEARDLASGRRAHYATDTDLYDISHPDTRWFADEIERDIVTFLDNLRKGNVLRRLEGSKFVLVFPFDDSYARVVGRWFMCTRTKQTAAPTDSDYEPVV